MAAGSVEVESSVEAAVSASPLSECLSWLDNLKIHTAVTKHHSQNLTGTNNREYLLLLASLGYKCTFKACFMGTYMLVCTILYHTALVIHHYTFYLILLALAYFSHGYLLPLYI